MKKALYRAAALAACLLLVAGCNGSFAGKGTLVSQTGQGKASLLFRVSCPFASDTVSGKVHYNDLPSRVQLIGKATDVGSDGLPLTCSGDRSEGHYIGTYTSRYGAGGTFTMDLIASSRKCAGHGQVTIAATSGVHSGYTNTSCFSGRIRPIGRNTFPGLPCPPICAPPCPPFCIET